MPVVPKSGESGNRLLDLLPAEEFDSLAPSLRLTKLGSKQVVHQFEDDVSHVHFPTTALLSALTVLQENDSIEAAPIGWDGFAGLTAALGVAASPHRVVCQMPGEAYILARERFVEALDQYPTLSRLVRRYTAFTLRLASQTLACNVLHTVEMRACRWLLMMHDHVKGDEFPLTHEFMAHMLGVRRHRVTLVFGTLHTAGLMSAARGVAVVRDRAALEGLSCVCYQMIRDYYRGVVR